MKSKDQSVFISIAGMDPDWIVGKISEDIKFEISKRGINCNYGSPDQYNNEHICHHMGWAYAQPNKSAKINSLFITHIDDSLKENLLKSLKNKFDYFIAMSSEEKDYLLNLGFDSKKTFGISLPVRNNYIRPISLGIFSSCYKDGRKNENWILKFAKKYSDVNLLNFIFIGPAWGGFVKKLENNEISFEWHSASKKLPFEYSFQQNKLNSIDYYFYIGNDGGSMGSYDAYAYGNRLILMNESYHKDIPNVDFRINNYDDFEKILLKIISDQKKRISFFNSRSITNYVNTLFSIWLNNYKSSDELNKNIIDIKRKNYKNLSIRRILSHIKKKLS